MEELIQGSRGSQGPVTSQSAENTYDALKKYAMDMVAMAEDGKLDPVIGTRRRDQTLHTGAQ